MSRILLIEDEPAYAEPLAALLAAEGFEVTTAATGNGGLEVFERAGADLVLLDLMLPDIPGLQVCRTLRSRATVPIIVVSALDGELDRVLGLELGADDYLTKPFSSLELLARVRAVLRRAHDVDLPLDGVLESGPVRMDVARHTVTVRGEPIALPLKEFEVLEELLRDAGRVLARGQLIDRIWGPHYTGDTKTLDVHVKRLRAKIEPDPAQPRHLVTVRGLGYRFEA
ncbi:MAG: response regulator transcription factor [Dermatophilaceae bacterium]